MRLAVVASHPIQYHAPIFRTLAERLDLKVFFGHQVTKIDQAKAGFGVGFDWDVDLLSGYEHVFLRNAARQPGLDRFGGCDTPDIRAQLAQDRFDALLVMGWHFKTYVQATLAAKRLKLPLLVRGDSQLTSRRSALKRALKAVSCPVFLRIFDAALYVGQRSQAYWHHYHYPKARLFFSPHCVDTKWFGTHATTDARNSLRARLGVRPERKVVLFAGKLLPFKRPIDAVEAIASLKAKGCELDLMIAGSGPPETEIATRASESGGTGPHLGFCNKSEMAAPYPAAHLLLFSLH